MAFQTDVHAKLTIDGETYAIGEHPFAPGIPYGQEGRQGTVYLLESTDTSHKKAIKVFRSKLINPSTVHLSSQISKFAAMNGLAACERATITPHNNPELLAKEPDLLYAVLMPWIEGPTWMDMILNKQPITRRQSYTAAYALVEILVTMEQRGLAHCDLSGPNVMMPMFTEGRNPVKSSNFVQLIDLEQLFSVQFERPEYLPAGSPGYAPKYASAQMWNAQGDRFAGAVLIMEMLAACTGTFTQHAWGESYFDPGELQTHCDRYDKLVQAVKPLWGAGVTSLMQRAWESDELGHCPTFGEWMLELSKIDQSVLREDVTVSMQKREEPRAALPRREEQTMAPLVRQEAAAAAAPAARPAAALPKPEPAQPVRPTATSKPDQNGSAKLMRKARDYESKGNLPKAIETYRSILALQPHESVAKEIEIAIESLQKQLSDQSKQKRKRSPGKLLGKLMKPLIALVIVGVIGTGGYWAYNYFKGLADAGPVQTKAQKQAVNAEIAQLKQELADRDKAIALMSKEIEELRKPIGQRSDELVQKLLEQYSEIQKLAEKDSAQDQELHEKVFAATETYMRYVNDYYKYAYNLDEYVQEQIDIVEHYYFPFIYNKNRNAQLNFKFYTDYKDHFLPGGPQS
ncbi:hypothetical protein D3P09_16670 [Paenibacillus pinisoli]|uniref:Protein kinase domain-containing protein n=1 Tax=Paenibacillus pinisoli TaxID=1276110 RepID=A0A3A6PEJ3_9BACL|nr:hypothetical protein [Paenibacillus pinisoli]RJX39125.1 hypothetical protein D3P09_16670 [Paenibacillus pinisoli]